MDSRQNDELVIVAEGAEKRDLCNRILQEELGCVVAWGWIVGMM